MGFISAAIAVMAAVTVGSAVVQHEQQKKSERAAAERAAAELKLQRELASQAMAPVTTNEGLVDLKSEEALSEEDILRKSKRNRLRVGRTEQVTTATPSVGTGLSVG